MLWLMMMCIALLASACTSTGKCRRGALACVCTRANSCDSGAVCRQGMCVKAVPGATDDDDAGLGAGGMGGTGGAGATAGTGAAGAGGAVVGCAATTVDAACREYCLAVCNSEAEFCRSSRCAADYCEPGGGAEVSQSCRASCGTGSNAAACLNDMCASQTRVTCAQFGFMNDDGTIESACFNNDPLCTVTGVPQ